MVIFRDHRPRFVRGRDGLQRFRRNRPAGKSQPVFLPDEASAVDFDRFGRDVRGDELRLSKAESPLDCLWPAVVDRALAAVGFWFPSYQRRAALDSIQFVFAAT